ncbi:protein phosphatase 2C domain-containing protein [Streptomyces sp. NPDC047141]|uniref:protein phosphatase 2C domain-containing protein n=1 Tax=Streptomyces sp. NPDC047141 TaxID=3155738 RepID=UPI0033D8DCD6
MTQQGDSWWDKLYDESAPDPAPTVPGETLDDHFDTTPRTVPGRSQDPVKGAPEPVPDAPPPAPPTSSVPPRPPLPPPPDTTPPSGTLPPAPRPARPPITAPSPASTAPNPVSTAPNPSPASTAPNPSEPSPPPAAAPSPPPPAPSPPPTTPSRPPVPPKAAAPGPRPSEPSPPVAPEALAPSPPPPAPPQPPAPPKAAAPSPQTSEPGPPPPPAPPVAPASRPSVPPAVAASDPRRVPSVGGPAPWEGPDGGGPRTFPAPAPAPPVAGTPTVQVPLEPDPEESGAQELTVVVSVPRPRAGFVGSRPPTYEPEPTALPVARPGELAELVADTVLDGARYGTCTVRAASVRGDSARYRGEPRRDALLTARFGHDETALVLVAVAAGSRAAEDAHLAAADACRWIGEAVCRSHARLSEDIRSGRRGDLKSGLHRLTDRTYGKLRARAAERGLAPDEYTATLRCLLVPADPDCRTRVFFGIGGGGLFRLRDGSWQDLEPLLPEPAAVTGAPVVGFGSPPAVREATEEGDRLTMDLGIATAPPLVEDPVPPPAEPFRFRASVARAGDTLLLASPGLAEPMRGEPALAHELAARWGEAEPPGLAAFLADTQLRVTGYADDRTGVAVWEA